MQRINPTLTLARLARTTPNRAPEPQIYHQIKKCQNPALKSKISKKPVDIVQWCARPPTQPPRRSRENSPTHYSKRRSTINFKTAKIPVIGSKIPKTTSTSCKKPPHTHPPKPSHETPQPTTQPSDLPKTKKKKKISKNSSLWEKIP